MSKYPSPNTVRISYSLGVGPDPSHWNLTVTIHERLMDAKAEAKKIPVGWMWGIVRMEDRPWQGGRRSLAACHPAIEQTIIDWCAKVNDANPAG